MPAFLDLNTWPGRILCLFVSWLLWYSFDWLWSRYSSGAKVRKLRDYIAKHPQSFTALAVSCVRDIEPHVRKFLDESKETQGIPLHHVYEQSGLDQDHEWHAFYDRIKKEIKQLTDGGAKRILLFVNAPTPISIKVGSILIPGPETLVYHFVDATYRPIFLLNQNSKLS